MTPTGTKPVPGYRSMPSGGINSLARNGLCSPKGDASFRRSRENVSYNVSFYALPAKLSHSTSGLRLLQQGALLKFPTLREKEITKMNTKPILLTGLALIGLLGTSWAQSGRTNPSQERQDDKNLMRNLGSGLGAAALSSARNGRMGDAIVLGAGAALAGKKYEDARKAQNDESRYGRDDRSDRYGRNDRYDSNDRYNTDAYDRDRYPSPSRWERERIERERRDREERILRERLERERCERIERERCERIERERREREREEREARIRWEREHRGSSWDRDRDGHCRDHRHG